MAGAYKAFVRSEKAKRAFAEVHKRNKDEEVEVPADLAERVRDLIKDSPEAWDAARCADRRRDLRAGAGGRA
jgi:hypothetical protein